MLHYALTQVQTSVVQIGILLLPVLIKACTTSTDSKNMARQNKVYGNLIVTMCLKP